MDFIFKMLSFFTQKARIDSFIFWIHYRVTFVILVIFAVIVGYEIYHGGSISCRSTDYGDFNQKDLNTMCSLQPTYIMLDDWDSKVGLNVLYPGVGKYSKTENLKYYSNYHQVLLVLCLQAIFFYLPWFFWKRMEGGKILFLTRALMSPFLTEDQKESKKYFIAEYFASNKNNHLLYFAFYALAEFLNFANVVAQLIFMNAFWGGNFSEEVLKYGREIWHKPDRSDALLKIFPRYTKCHVYKWGSSGDVHKTSATCIMPVNSINEKIYVFLWFWCIILAVISFLALVYRALTIIPRCRSTITFLRVRMINKCYLEAIVGNCGLGDWLVLDLLAKNLDPLTFRDLVEHLINRLGLKENSLTEVL